MSDSPRLEDLVPLVPHPNTSPVSNPPLHVSPPRGSNRMDYRSTSILDCLTSDDESVHPSPGLDPDGLLRPTKRVHPREEETVKQCRRETILVPRMSGTQKSLGSLIFPISGLEDVGSDIKVELLNTNNITRSNGGERRLQPRDNYIMHAVGPTEPTMETFYSNKVKLSSFRPNDLEMTFLNFSSSPSKNNLVWTEINEDGLAAKKTIFTDDLGTSLSQTKNNALELNEFDPSLLAISPMNSTILAGDFNNAGDLKGCNNNVDNGVKLDPTNSKIDGLQFKPDLEFSNISNPLVTYSNTSNSIVGYSNTSNLEMGYNNTSNLEKGYSNNSNPIEGCCNTSNLEVGYSNASNPEVGYSNASNLEVGYNNTSNIEVEYSNASNLEVGYSNISNLEVGYSNNSNPLVGYSNTSNLEVGYSNNSNLEEGYSKDTAICPSIKKQVYFRYNCF